MNGSRTRSTALVFVPHAQISSPGFSPERIGGTAGSRH
ncbi:hypothetical protein X907_0568 [Glycocaulis alkaliphilus]|uniref:Uncharacterized protein n=1 Tax=Glycocaulis alkaliphilus TaxID=1434191 RepID=A0A3T0E6S3_9PROT|nr:hypothetical protein X907_0568 [Glycocaulis alkaliphilus]